MTVIGTVRAIKRRSLHEELAEHLEEMIVTGALPPGSKVPERDLCEQFDVSRTPLREALKVLANQGLVVLETNRGARVSRITLEDVEAVFPVMGALEALSGELACTRITDAEIAAIEALHASMLSHYQARDLAAYFADNQAIHEAILAAAGNEVLSSQYRSLAARIRLARYLANMTDERWRQAVDEHERMMACLRARDGTGLAAVQKEHLRNKFETVRAWLAANGHREDRMPEPLPQATTA